MTQTKPSAADLPLVIRELITTAAGQYFPRTPSTPDLFRFQDVLEAFAAAVAAHVRERESHLLNTLMLDCLEIDNPDIQCRHCGARHHHKATFTHYDGCVVGQIIVLRAAALAPSQEKS